MRYQETTGVTGDTRRQQDLIAGDSRSYWRQQELLEIHETAGVTGDTRRQPELLGIPGDSMTY